MKKLKEGNIMKKLIATLLIIAMLLPQIPFYVFAADGDESSEEVVFNVEWLSGNETEEVHSNQTVGLKYQISFNQIESGFKDIKLLIQTDEVTQDITGSVQDYVTCNGSTLTGNGFAQIEYGNKDAGQSVLGEASVKFGDAKIEMDREVKLILKTTYTDPNTNEDYEHTIEKSLSAHVTPATSYNYYTYNMKWQNETIFGLPMEKKPYIELDDYHDLGTSEYGGHLGYYYSNGTVKYPIKLSSYVYTQNLSLTARFKMYSFDDNNNEVNEINNNFQVNWGGLEEVFQISEPQVANGYITYTLTRGEDNGVFNKETAFSIDNDYIISVKYTFNNPDPRVSTRDTMYFYGRIEMNGSGYDVQKEYNKEEVATKKTIKPIILTYKDSTTISSYTPGASDWITVEDWGTVAKSGDKDSTKLTSEIMSDFNENKNLDISAKVAMIYHGGKPSEGDGEINYLTPYLEYEADDSTIKTIELTPEQFRLKSITPVEANTAKSEVRINGVQTAINGEYIIPEGTNVNNFSIIMKDFLLDYVEGYTVKYTLNRDALADLSDTEIEQINSIYFRITSSNDYIKANVEQRIQRESQNKVYNYSYAEVSSTDSLSTSVGNLNDLETKNITIKMYKDPTYFGDTTSSTGDTITKYVINKNPIFYVTLPSAFIYEDYDVSMENVGNGYDLSIDEENLDIITLNGKECLVIPCIGTYYSDYFGSRSSTINVSFSRRLKETDSSKQSIEVYMITDNENYYNNEVKNSYDEIVKLDGEHPNTCFRTSLGFDIVGNGELAAKTKVEYNTYEYETLTSNEKVDKGEKEEPIVVDSNTSVTYKSAISAVGTSLTNLTMIARLPKANNTEIYDGTTPILRDSEGNGYKLPDEFYDKHENQINGNAINSVVTQADMTNFKFIGIYTEKIKDVKDVTLVDPSNYTIYYSNDDNADFTTTNFTQYNEGDTLTNAKNIKVVFNKNFRLPNGKELVMEYTMDMPDTPNMVGATTAVKYTKYEDVYNVADEDYDTIAEQKSHKLYSPAIFVINANTKGTINVQKKFENLPVGTAPEGETLDGIQFKLQYFDPDTGEKVFLKNGANDVVATTDTNGKAIFTDIPAGQYFLYEVEDSSRFKDYYGIGNIQTVTLEPGTTVDYTGINNLKHGTIIINKKWLGANDEYGADKEVEFTLMRVNEGNENMPSQTYTIKTENGVAKKENIPYGKYLIKETKGINYWTPSEESVYVTLNSDTVNADGEVSTDFENAPGKGSLEIVKTVPSGESVDELTFKITGRGLLNFQDNNGNTVNTNTSMEIVLANNEQPSNVTITKEEENTKVTITISDLYLGMYSIEEIRIPKIDGTQIEKYVPATANENLTTNGQTVRTNLTNNYKTGYLQIQKTAKLKETVIGENGEPEVKYTDIGDLTGIKVNVTGTTYYGETVNKTIELDKDGYAITRLVIGEYTIEEEVPDGYTAYYGTDASASTTAPHIVIDNNKTVTQNIYNEHTGVGYVRVEKTLEGITDPQKVVDEGIKFKIFGHNIAGGEVEETVTINKVDTNRNVAYGISGPISVGGEYELEEVNVPEFYEGEEAIPLDITTDNTLLIPLTQKVTNTRGKGNLEIITKTEPEGGPLTGITYRVTEIEMDGQGGYKKVEGTSVVLEGENGLVNTSWAGLENINAGYYLVEQLTVPSGWVIDVNQIVEVPVYNTGYVTFEITEKTKLEENLVTINKVILDEDGNVADEADLERAKLNEDESFEVKITNTETNEVYYVFTSPSKPGVIQGLDEGRYKIEEVFKPKYLTEGFYFTANGESNPNGVSSGEITETKFSSDSEGTEIGYFNLVSRQDKVQDLNITVKNTMNTSYGFGGQKHIDNLSKTNVEEEEITRVNRAIIYAVDESGNAISGAVFRLLNSDGNVVSLEQTGTQFEIVNKKLIIKGIPVGKYTLECIEIPAGYEKPEDKEIMVYEDATQVTRVEIQKIVPRGGLTLSTIYKDEEGNTKYLARSKYKVVNSETGELVKFVKTARGNYRKSNLENASPYVSLKSGKLELEGIETGEYQIGIVDVVEGFGIIKDYPDTPYEVVTVEAGVVKDVSVEVIKKKIIQVETSRYVTAYLNEKGELYTNGVNYNYTLGDGSSSSSSQHSEFKRIAPVGVTFSKISLNENNANALDSNGKLWTWGSQGNTPLTGSTSTLYEPTYVGDFGTNKKLVDVNTNSRYIQVLDEDGVLYHMGYVSGDGTENAKTTVSPIAYFSDNGIKIAKLPEIGDEDLYYAGVIDTNGKVWMWGQSSSPLGNGDTSHNVLIPICISDFTELRDTEVVDLYLADQYAMALDKDGNVWVWNGYYGKDYPISKLVGGECLTPKKIDSSKFGGKKIKTIAGADSSSNQITLVLDENGDLWQVGNGAYGDGENPTCVTKASNNSLYNKKIELIAVASYGNNVIAVDSNNVMWGWGNSEYGEAGPKTNDEYISNPQVVPNGYSKHLEYNLKFKDVYSHKYSSFAIDDTGRVWAWGSNYYGELGFYEHGNNAMTPRIVNIDGNPKIKKISIGSRYNSTLMLSDNGEVFTTGGYGTTTSPVNITDQLPDNIKIVDVFVTGKSNDDKYVIDSDGKVYSANSSNMGELVSAPDGIKIVKLTDYSSDCDLALDKDGNIYELKNMELTLKEVKDNTKFVDIESGYLLDTQGRLWSNHNTNNRLRCITALPSNKLFAKYQIDSNYKIVKIYNASISSNEAVLIIDSNGDKWISSSDSITPLDESVPEFVTVNGWLMIDTYGQVWVYRNISNSCGEAGIGTTTSISGPTCISSSVSSPMSSSFRANNVPITKGTANKLYNIKIKELVNDHFVIDENDDIWYFSEEGQPTNISQYNVGYENPMFGKSIFQYVDKDYAVTSDYEIWKVTGDYPAYIMKGVPELCDYCIVSFDEGNESYLALDNNGKIWVGDVSATNGEAICLNNTEGNELYNAQNNIEGFKISEIAKDSRLNDVRLIDNQGKVWRISLIASSSNMNDYISDIKCLSDYEESSIYQYCQTNNCNLTFTIENKPGTIEPKSGELNKTQLKDNNGDIWIKSNNDYIPLESTFSGDLANYLSSHPDVTVNYATANNDFCITSDGNVFANHKYAHGIGGTEPNTNARIQNLSNIKDVILVYSKKNSGGSNYGSYYYYYWALSDDGVYRIMEYFRWSGYNQPVYRSYSVNKLSDIKLTDIKAVKAIGSELDGYVVLDGDGKLWAVGKENYTGYGIKLSSSSTNFIWKCISDNSSYKLYGKTIKDIGDLGFCFYAIDSDDKLYAWDRGNTSYGMRAYSTVPVAFTRYKSGARTLYGDNSNESIIKFVRKCYDKGKAMYNGYYNTYGSSFATFDAQGKPCRVYNGTVSTVAINKRYSGIGIINQVIGEWTVKSEEDAVFDIIPSSTTTFYLQGKNPAETPTAVSEGQEITLQIDGVTIVKQTEHKALDSNGNLYVWDTKTGLNYTAQVADPNSTTGLSNLYDGVVNLTQEEYYTRPVYLKGNGWTVIKSSF